MKVKSREGNLNSIVHQLDLRLRKVISTTLINTMKSLNTTTDTKEMGKQIALLKKHFLEDVRQNSTLSTNWNDDDESLSQPNNKNNNQLEREVASLEKRFVELVMDLITKKKNGFFLPFISPTMTQ